MRGSPCSRAARAGLGRYNDSGISEERKRQWLTRRLRRSDVRLMREMFIAGWSSRYIGKIFGVERRMCWSICKGLVHRDA